MLYWILYALYGLMFAWHAAHYIELKGISKKGKLVVDGKLALKMLEMNLFLLFLIAFMNLMNT